MKIAMVEDFPSTNLEYKKSLLQKLINNKTVYIKK